MFSQTNTINLLQSWNENCLKMFETQSRIMSTYAPWSFVPSPEVVEKGPKPVAKVAKKKSATPKAKTAKSKVAPVVAKAIEPTTKPVVKAKVATQAKAKPVMKTKVETAPIVKAAPEVAAKPAANKPKASAPIVARKTADFVEAPAVVAAPSGAPKRRLTATPPATLKTN